MDYLKVRKWKQFQHYKYRKPPWIRLYNSLIDDDPEFDALPPEQKWAFVGLTLLASRSENRIPADLPWLEKKLGIVPDLKLLAHWVISDDASMALADCKQDASNVLAQSRDREEKSRELPLAPPTESRETTLKGIVEHLDGTQPLTEEKPKKPRKLTEFQKCLEHWKALHLDVLKVPYLNGNHARDNKALKPVLATYGLLATKELIGYFWECKGFKERGEAQSDRGVWIANCAPSIPTFASKVPMLLDEFTLENYNA